MKKCCVIGSINADLVITLPRFHQRGETIAGSGFAIFPGGKGANQAVALGRLGAPVAMVGGVGADANGQMYLDVLDRERVDAEWVQRFPDETTGVALIEVEQGSGENRIAINAGANRRIDRAFIDRVLGHLQDYDLFLLQLETPLDTVMYAAERLHAAGKTVILDPAPAPGTPLIPDFLKNVDYITPNETELSALTGMPVAGAAQIEAAAKALRDLGARAVIAKMGAAGALLVSGTQARHFAGFPVSPVDTTAAGDTFNAGFACALAGGMSPDEAIRFANAAAALSTTKMGAQSGMPTRAQVERFMEDAQ